MALRLVSLLVLVLSSNMMLTSALRVWGLRAVGLSGDALGNRPDPYVKVWCGGVSGGQTEVITGTNNPTWNTAFNFSCKPGATLQMEVCDKDLQYDDRLGLCTHTISASYGNGNELRCTSLKKGTLYYRYTV